MQHQLSGVDQLLQVAHLCCGQLRVAVRGLMAGDTVERRHLGIVDAQGGQCAVEPHAVLLLGVVGGQRGQHAASLVAQPPVVVDVVHRHLDTVEVEALQVGDQRGNLSFAHHVVAGLLRPFQSHQLVGRIDAEHVGLRTFRTEVEQHEWPHVVKSLVRRHDVIVGVGLPLQLGVVAIHHEDALAVDHLAVDGVRPVHGLGEGVGFVGVEVIVPLEVEHRGIDVVHRRVIRVPGDFIAQDGGVEGLMVGHLESLVVGHVFVVARLTGFNGRHLLDLAEFAVVHGIRQLVEGDGGEVEALKPQILFFFIVQGLQSFPELAEEHLLVEEHESHLR